MGGRNKENKIENGEKKAIDWVPHYDHATVIRGH